MLLYRVLLYLAIRQPTFSLALSCGGRTMMPFRRKHWAGKEKKKRARKGRLKSLNRRAAAQREASRRLIRALDFFLLNDALVC